MGRAASRVVAPPLNSHTLRVHPDPGLGDHQEWRVLTGRIGTTQHMCTAGSPLLTRSIVSSDSTYTSSDKLGRTSRRKSRTLLPRMHSQGPGPARGRYFTQHFGKGRYGGLRCSWKALHSDRMESCSLVPQSLAQLPLCSISPFSEFPLGIPDVMCWCPGQDWTCFINQNTLNKFKRFCEA